jgi:uncharacterized protein (TIGR04255 family)
MPFPDTPRVVYGKSPLVEVICQLRFPTILKIGAELPVAFQERVRGEYPEFRAKPEAALNLPPQLIETIPQDVQMLLPSPSGSVYDFISADEQWVIGLTRDFLALTARRYERWEVFEAQLQLSLRALIDVYQPAYFTRVGLRYQDVIDRNALHLTSETWATLLNPYVAGEYAAPELSGRIAGVKKQAEVRLERFESLVRIQHGTVLVNDQECYLIDSDFFTHQRTEIKGVHEVLAYFNRQSGRLFRWCISEQLHQAMEPNPV